jgi:hypothetical protein
MEAGAGILGLGDRGICPLSIIDRLRGLAMIPPTSDKQQT